MTGVLEDTFGRFHNYLRISLTDNCNLRCFYCMPEEDYSFTPHHRLMQADEIHDLARIFVANGVDKIRLTGGEPLVRKDSPAIIRALAGLPVDLVMTTNGIRIDDMLPEIQQAGFRSINISLDTLKRDRFLQITRRDYFDRVRRNIDLLVSEGIPVKINMVVMKGVNDDEILDFVELTREQPVEVRFIEFMPFDGNRWSSNSVLTLQEVLARISERYTVEPAERRPNDTTKPFTVSGHRGKIAVISTMTMPFCGDCNRLRLTADGKLKNCLFSKEETDLLSALRQGHDIVPLIQASVRAKSEALGGQFSGNFEHIDAGSLKNRSMISIGG